MHVSNNDSVSDVVEMSEQEGATSDVIYRKRIIIRHVAHPAVTLTKEQGEEVVKQIDKYLEAAALNCLLFILAASVTDTHVNITCLSEATVTWLYQICS